MQWLKMERYHRIIKLALVYSIFGILVANSALSSMQFELDLSLISFSFLRGEYNI